MQDSTKIFLYENSELKKEIYNEFKKEVKNLLGYICDKIIETIGEKYRTVVENEKNNIKPLIIFEYYDMKNIFWTDDKAKFKPKFVGENNEIEDEYQGFSLELAKLFGNDDYEKNYIYNEKVKKYIENSTIYHMKLLDEFYESNHENYHDLADLEFGKNSSSFSIIKEKRDNDNVIIDPKFDYKIFMAKTEKRKYLDAYYIEYNLSKIDDNLKPVKYFYIVPFIERNYDIAGFITSILKMLCAKIIKLNENQYELDYGLCYKEMISKYNLNLIFIKEENEIDKMSNEELQSKGYIKFLNDVFEYISNEVMEKIQNDENVIHYFTYDFKELEIRKFKNESYEFYLKYREEIIENLFLRNNSLFEKVSMEDFSKFTKERFIWFENKINEYWENIAKENKEI